MESLREEIWYGDDIGFPKLVFLLVVLAIGHLLDLLSTFWVLRNVDGAFEGNPVAAKFIHIVPLAILAKVLVVVIVCVLFYYVYLKNQKVALIFLCASIILIYAVVCWNTFIVPSNTNFAVTMKEAIIGFFPH